MKLRVFMAVVALVAVAEAQPTRVEPSPAPAAVDPRMLPVWSGHVEGGAVQVHALDADAEALRKVLAPRAQLVALPVARRISGRIAVKKRAAALDALLALEPALTTSNRPMRGGTHVDLDFHAASTVDLYRLFASIMRTNIVVLAPASKLTVRVKRAGVSGVLAEVARVSGAELDRPAPNLIVVRAASEPRVPFMAASGARLSLDARQIHAGILVALIRALDGPRPPAELLRDASLVCNGGKAIDLRLTKVAGSVALSVIALAGGADLRGPRCALPPLPPGTDLGTLRLAGVVERGTRRMAAVEVTGKGAFLLDGSDPAWTIGSSWIDHRSTDPHGVDQRVAFQLHPGLDPIGDPVAPPDPGPRLAATVIDGRERVAIVELRGWAQIWTQGRPVPLDGDMVDFTIEPGKVTLRDGRVLQLTPRPATAP